MTDDSPFEAGSASVTVRRRAKNGDPESERTFHILGTAHVSQKSIEEVREVIRKVRPDTVCVELDKMRYEALTDDTRWRKLDIFQVIRDGKVLFLMASLALQSFQKRIGEKLGVRPGAELLAAVEIAEEIGAKVVLADRDVQATLKRTWRNLSFVSKGKLLAALVGSLFDSTELEEEEIEALKNRDQITDAMSQLAEAMPEVKGPLIDERDQYLMSAVEDAPGKVVVAVVGAAHVDGMTRHLGKSVDRDKLSEIPQPSLISRSLKWLIPTIILGAFA
ncbi:MAG TPA: TraB family protein, partial [Sorangium sp.]|nr:TraB family protein [Sorangium sp.]